MPVELGYDFCLPRVECLDCQPEWKCWGNGLFEFPTLQLNFLNKREFCWERIMSVAEFEKLQTRIEKAIGRAVDLVPGASIGLLSGKAWKRKLDDIVWGGLLYPQISKRACELLASEGIELGTAECVIRYYGYGCPIDTHLAIQAEPVAMLTEESLDELGLLRCSRCGHYKHTSPTLNRNPAGDRLPYQINRAAWPKGQHLVTVRETLDVLASPEFIEAVKRHNLVDIAFLETGDYV